MPVLMGGLCQCTFGAAPGPFMVLPTNMTLFKNMPGATIMDHVPLLNIMPFGMCMSMANPMVIAATAAALGVLTPMPCIPVTASPWLPLSPTILIKNMPILNSDSIVMCNWGGVIKVAFPGVSLTNLK
ncbi:MAG: DUF4280 domain-containing protein [Holosporales bacterium]|nr:DUF4280 domain-containing protein [Holosporales bacterium]